MIYTINEIKNKVKSVAVKYKIDAVYLFGSYARGEATLKSDLDFLVYGGLEFKLTQIFSFAEDIRGVFGISVDVYEIGEINIESDFYKKIMEEKIRVY